MLNYTFLKGFKCAVQLAILGKSLLQGVIKSLLFYLTNSNKFGMFLFHQRIPLTQGRN